MTFGRKPIPPTPDQREHQTNLRICAGLLGLATVVISIGGAMLAGTHWQLGGVSLTLGLAIVVVVASWMAEEAGQ